MHKLYKCCFVFIRYILRQVSFLVNFLAVDFEPHVLNADIRSFRIIGNRFQHIGIVRVFEQLPRYIRIVS